MSPTDREFETLASAVAKLDDRLERIETQLAEQRGWFQAARWLGMGSLASAAGLWAWVTNALKSSAP